MATVTGYTAARMKQIEDTTVIDGHIEGDNLVLERRDGVEIDAGFVRGPKGDTGDPALPPALGSNGVAGNNTTTRYVRVGTVNGVGDLNGAQLIFEFNGGGNYDQQQAYSAKIHVVQRGSNNISVEVFDDNAILVSPPLWYSRQISTFVFEIWVGLTAYHAPVQIQPLMKWNGSFVYDNITSTQPSGLVLITPNSQKLIQTALLDGSYRGGKDSKVVFTPGGPLSSEAYPFMDTYNPQGSRTVRLLRSGKSFQIAGQTMDEKYPLPLGANWYTYSEITASKIFSDRVVANKLASGLVVLSGLLRINGTPPDGSTIVTLPPELAPDAALILPVMMGDTTQSMKINTNGTVTVYGDWPGNTYLSLDGVSFWPAGSVVWTPVGQGGSSFGANFEPWPDTATWGIPKWYKDPYGVVWFQGLVRVKVATSVDNTNIVSMPAGYRADLEQHFRGATYNPNYAGLGAKPADGLNWKTKSPGTVGQYISISGVSYLTPDAISKNKWKAVPSMANSWANHLPASFGGAQYTRREDGLCMSRGLIASGTMGAIVFYFDEELQPQFGKIIFIGISNNSNLRLDISSTRVGDSIPPGALTMQFGNNAWCSLDGLKWVP